ncbi:PIN domain-like protein [Raphanus sativus]|nr:PIN domain-like protein [Raphanus sativus]
MITVLGADGSDIYTRVKEVADRKLVHQMLNDALKDVQNNSSKSPILLVSNDKDFMGVIRDLRRYGYTVISAVSEMFAKNLPGVARLTQAFWFFEQLEKGHPPIHPSPMQNALAASDTVDLVWDVNMLPLPLPIDLKSLRNRINAGLRWVNSK